MGKVLKVYADGDLRVAFGGQTWTFNPACLSAQTMEMDANLMTAENPNESGSKDYLDLANRRKGASYLTVIQRALLFICPSNFLITFPEFPMDPLHLSLFFQHSCCKLCMHY